ncbi:MAG: hypothetical protein O2924_04240 [Chloroflexi bacterium]|nr:hypothetical protein [Chloroflexota bacterium]
MHSTRRVTIGRDYDVGNLAAEGTPYRGRDPLGDAALRALDTHTPITDAIAT